MRYFVQRGRPGSGLNDAYDGDGKDLPDVFESKGSSGVAGDDEQVCTLFLQELCAGDGVAGDGFVGLGTVGEAGGVAEIDVARSGDEREKGVKDGEAAKAGVEDPYGGIGGEQGMPGGHGWVLSGIAFVATGGVGVVVVSMTG